MDGESLTLERTRVAAENGLHNPALHDGQHKRSCHSVLKDRLGHFEPRVTFGKRKLSKGVTLAIPANYVHAFHHI